MIPFEIGVKSLAIALVGLGCVGAMRRFSAAQRYTATFAALICVCLVSLSTFLGPVYAFPKIRLAESAPSATGSRQSRSTFETGGAHGLIPTAADRPLAQESGLTSTIFAPRCATLFLLLWLAGSAAFLTRLTYRLTVLRTLRRRLRPVEDPRVLKMVEVCSGPFTRPVQLLVGDAGTTAMVWGHMNPVLVLPPEASQWSSKKLTAVLLHEFAHLQRNDWLFGVAGQMIATAFWLNPIVWLLLRRMELECECAADDRVLSSGISASSYAAGLLELVRNLKRSNGPAQSALAMARVSRLTVRVAAILNHRSNRNRASGFATLSLIGSVALVAIALGLGSTQIPPSPHRAPATRRALPIEPAPAESIHPPQRAAEGLRWAPRQKRKTYASAAAPLRRRSPRSTLKRRLARVQLAVLPPSKSQPNPHPSASVSRSLSAASAQVGQEITDASIENSFRELEHRLNSAEVREALTLSDPAAQSRIKGAKVDIRSVLHSVRLAIKQNFDEQKVQKLMKSAFAAARKEHTELDQLQATESIPTAP